MAYETLLQMYCDPLKLLEVKLRKSNWRSRIFRRDVFALSRFLLGIGLSDIGNCYYPSRRIAARIGC